MNDPEDRVTSQYWDDAEEICGKTCNGDFIGSVPRCDISLEIGGLAGHIACGVNYKFHVKGKEPQEKTKSYVCLRIGIVLKIVLFINIVMPIVPNVTASHTSSSATLHSWLRLPLAIWSISRVPLGCFGASWHEISSQSQDGCLLEDHSIPVVVERHSTFNIPFSSLSLLPKATPTDWWRSLDLP